MELVYKEGCFQRELTFWSGMRQEHGVGLEGVDNTLLWLATGSWLASDEVIGSLVHIASEAKSSLSKIG